MKFSPVNQTARNKRKSGLQYLSLGDDYSQLSDFEKAIHYYKQYLAICEELENSVAEGHAYSKLGKAYNSVGNTDKAMEFYKAQLSNAEKVGDKGEKGEALSSLGNLFLCIGKYRQAIDYHKIHLKITKILGDRVGEGRAYGNLGNDFYSLLHFERAKEYYEKHLKIIKELGDRNEEGKAYGNLGRVHRSLGDFAEAIEYHGEQLRIAKEEERKADEACAYYELGRDLESLDCSMEALQFYKLSKKLFYEIRADLRCKQTSPFKDEWKINLFEVFHCVHAALRRTYLKLNMDVEALFAVEDGRAQALEDILASRYGMNSAQLRLSGEGTTMSDMSKYISANTIVLELDDDRINIWFLLPGQSGQDVQVIRKSKEGYAQFETEMFKMKRTRSADVISPEQILDETDKNLIEVRDLESDLRFLYDFIFGAEADLVQGDEIVIVPHGPLCFVPFALLQEPSSKYLCESFRIRVVPSLTSMKMIADCPQADYHCKSGALLVGDPSMREVVYKGRRLVDLPFARKEVETIGIITNIKPLIGEEATKTKVLQQLNSVALIHIAAHGRIETGEIFLAPNPERTSQRPEENDYVLGMAEVQNMKLRARLVVLSCCHTGRGEVKSEGVIGIARAFLAAGARSVLVSLWAIEDEATHELMKNFYEHLTSGSTASEALKKAMECLIKSERFNHPRHWAPFVLIGDDVMLEFPERKLKSCIVSTCCRRQF